MGSRSGDIDASIIPYIMEKTVTNVANIATPLGLIAMGAAFDWGKAFAKIKPNRESFGHFTVFV